MRRVLHAGHTPRPLQEKSVRALHRDVVRVLERPAIRDRFTALGFIIVAGTPEQFAAVIKREIESYRKIVAEAGIRAE